MNPAPSPYHPLQPGRYCDQSLTRLSAGVSARHSFAAVAGLLHGICPHCHGTVGAILNRSRNEFGFHFQSLELCFRRETDDGCTEAWVKQGLADRKIWCHLAAKLQKAMGFKSFVGQKAVILASTESDGRRYGGRPRRGVDDASRMLCSICSRIWMDHGRVL